MTPGLAAMLLGVFVVPAVLLWAGHRLRRRPPRWRGAFWGAVIAHIVAVPIALVAAMFPAAEWDQTNAVRGMFGFWLLLLAPLIGAGIGSLLAGRAPRPEAVSR